VIDKRRRGVMNQNVTRKKKYSFSILSRRGRLKKKENVPE
jgi:hypothetical protein